MGIKSNANWLKSTKIMYMNFEKLNHNWNLFSDNEKGSLSSHNYRVMTKFFCNNPNLYHLSYIDSIEAN